MERDPYEVLLESLILGDSGKAIENQEARGQQDLIYNDVLPVDCPREQLETLGVVFGDMVDDLFIACTLPVGWKKVATDHSMWSDLVDDKGRVRGHIFYKAAFYDRSAHMRLSCRFSYGNRPVSGWGNGDYHDKPFESVVTDNGTVIWKSEQYPYGDYAVSDKFDKEAREWLTEHYPDWENSIAYWD